VRIREDPRFKTRYWNLLALNLFGEAIASLSLEVGVCPAVYADIAPVGKIAHQADQRRAALPYVAA